MSLEGNKPRKWIKNINLDNPTMHSHNVLSVLNPQISKKYDSPKKYYINNSSVEAYPKRTWGDNPNHNDKDSLDESIRHFKTIEHERTQQTPNGQRSSIFEDRKEKVWRSKSVMEPEVKHNIFYNPLSNLNYPNSKSIRNKQLHGYNILSNF